MSGVWVKVFPAPPVVKPELPGLGGWADITAVTGNPKKYEYTDANGVDWTAYEWAVDGSCTTTEGLGDVLLVGGGGGTYMTVNGMGGKLVTGTQKMSAGAQAVTIGAGGAHRPGGGAVDPAMGGPSTLGPLSTGVSGIGEAGSGSNTIAAPGLYIPFTSSITGTSQQYGRVATDANYGGRARPNFGDGGWNGGAQPGSSGVVIVRVPRANAKA
jgi:hypothetical protein